MKTVLELTTNENAMSIDVYYTQHTRITTLSNLINQTCTCVKNLGKQSHFQFHVRFVYKHWQDTHEFITRTAEL